MRFYFALASSPSDNEALFLSEATNFLFSYHYYKSDIQKVRAKMWDKKNNYFIDSGAFSAHTLGKVINIDEYILFIKELKFDTYANLDVIGNSEKSFQNEAYMRAKGLTPLPVFHFGENITYLDRILNSGVEYFCLGGMVQAADLDEWLVNVWEHIHKNKPGIKVHGFGLTDLELVLKYPWYSVDSSSWTSPVRFARFSVFNALKGKFYQKSVYEIFKENNIEYKPDEPIVGDKRKFILKAQVNEMLAAEKWLSEKRENFNYNYLSNKLNIFDL